VRAKNQAHTWRLTPSRGTEPATVFKGNQFPKRTLKDVATSEHPTVTRCFWCGDDPLYIAYHDNEWGIPVHDDRHLFEMLVLEGFQAGLSWITILRKREAFRSAFRAFDAEAIARFKQRDFDRLMQNAGIVRNRLKIESSVLNAKAFLAIHKQPGGFDHFLWEFTGHQTLRNPRGTTRENIPATSPESDRLSKELLRSGFKFVGSTICYAFMQAVGMVDDHVEGCWKYQPRSGARNL
jgi:DNA-3-methyladenine glycosylase I